MATAAEVQALYNSIIGRTGTPDEVAWWVNRGMSAEEMAPEFIAAKNDAATVQKAADIVKSGASQVVNPTTWADVLSGVTNAAPTNAVSGGLLGDIVAPTAPTAAATNAGGLLGATPTSTANQTVSAADITNLYKNIIGSTPEAEGMNYWLGKAASGMDLPTMEGEFKKAMTDPALLAKRADLIKSGASTNVVNAGAGAGAGTSMPFGFTGYQSGIREVPFGGTVVGPNVVQPSASYTAAMYAPSIQDAFLRSMQYQSQLPNMLPVFNPAATPSIYPQIAQELGRYNIAGAQVPSWLRVTTPTDANTLATARTTSTGE